MKILSSFFSIFGRYAKMEEDYERSRYPLMRFLLFVITAALPTLTFLGGFYIGFENGLWFIKILLFFMFGLLIVKAPKDLLLLSLVAINHGIWIIITRKAEKKKDLIDTVNWEDPQPKKKKRKANWQNYESNPAWDFVLGILGLFLSVASLIAPFVILLGSLQNA